MDGSDFTFTCAYTGEGQIRRFQWERNKDDGAFVLPPCYPVLLNTTLYSISCPDNHTLTLTILYVTLGEHGVLWQCQAVVNTTRCVSDVLQINVLRKSSFCASEFN